MPKGRSRLLQINPYTWGFLVTALLLLLAGAVTWLGYENFKRGEERELEVVMGQMKQDIHDFMNKSYNAAFALTHAISPTEGEENFEFSAKYIQSRHPYIYMMTIIQADTIKMVYPLEGNESLIGQNILSGERLKYEMREIVKQKEIHFSGPLKFTIGPMIVGSLPIMASDRLWGLAVIVVKLEDFFELIKLDQHTQNGYLLQFSKTNPITKETEFFIPANKETKPSTKLTHLIEEGDWQLELSKLYTLEGLSGLLLLAFFSVAFALVCGVFVKNIFEKPFLLERMMQQQSGLLIASEQRNKAILAALPDFLLVINKQGDVVDYHVSHNKEESKEQFNSPYKKFIDLDDPEIRIAALENIKTVLASNELKKQEYKFKGDYFEARYVKNNDEEVLVIVRNITDRIKQMKAIEEQNTQLKDIAWMQSHEMRAPLARIMTIIHWLELDLEKNPKEYVEMLEHIINSAYDMDKIIAGITSRTREITVRGN